MWGKFINLAPRSKYSLMERIIIVRRETKKDGLMNVRLRLRDGRGVDLFHKTDLKVKIEDLEKFTEEGERRNKVTVYNREFKAALDKEIAAMRQAYAGLCERMEKTHISSKLFEEEIGKILNRKELIETPDKEPMLDRYRRFVDEAYKNGDFNEKRMKHYCFVGDSLERFLAIKGISKISADEFTADMLAELDEYFADEYLYAQKKKYAHLFSNITNKRHWSKKQREPNTVVGRMKKMQAFFNCLLERKEIEVSPFHKLGKKRRAKVMTERYEDEPVGLTRSELFKVMETEVPETLQQAKDAFLVQCAFGYRIGDYQKMTMDKIRVTEDGIPYIHYLPQKTKRSNSRKEEIQTPILRYAFDLIKKWQFKFTIIRYPGGMNGYNKKIRQLLELCGIDRPIREYNRETEENEYRPLYEVASSKTCRSTHVDMMRTVQVDLYLAGLHNRGSNAVHHYTEERISDHFKLMCVAYNQPLYRVDKELNIIEEPK